MTAAAGVIFVRRYQRLRGLRADGDAGKLTRSDLTSLLGVPEPPRPNMEVVYAMLPGARRENVDRYLPAVLEALTEFWLDDAAMVRMAIATIRAESAGFVPVDEGRSKYNTDPGSHPFNRYDDRRDLGNRGEPDGARYKGRGFVQLTGRANYQAIGRRLGLPLEEEPEIANEPAPAARILAAFLSVHEWGIRAALEAGDLARARRLVNGGRHGLGEFRAAWTAGAEVLA